MYKTFTVTLTGHRSLEIDVDDLFLQLSRQDLPSLKELNILGAWSDGHLHPKHYVNS